MMRRFAALMLLSLSGCNSSPSVRLDPASPTPTPSSPVGLIDSAGIGRVLVRWSPNAEAEAVTSYRVYRAASSWTIWSSSLPEAHLTTGLTCCAFDATDLENELRYFFAVSAVNAGGESPQSPQITSKPPGWRGSLQFGTTGSDYATSVVVAPDSSIYVVGATDGALDGNTKQGSIDFFISKFEPSGARAWTRQFGSSGRYYIAAGASTDIYGNVYVTGETGDGTNGGAQSFVSKHLASDGATEWMRQLGTSFADSGSAVSVDGFGNVLIAGRTYGDLNGPNQGLEDLFVAKYDNTGSLLWVRQRGTAFGDSASGIDVDGAGDVYVGGSTAGSMDGNSNAGGSDLLLVKYSAAGVFQWTRQRGTSGDDGALSVSVDGAANIYIAGQTGGGLDGNTSLGGFDTFAIRFDVDGNKQWTTQVGSAGDDFGRSASTDGSGRLFIAGSTTGNFEGTGANGGDDAFLIRIDSSNGLPLWKRQPGTSVNDVASGVGTGTAVFIAGKTRGDFVLPNVGQDDIFLMKYSLAGEVQ